MKTSTIFAMLTIVSIAATYSCILLQPDTTISLLVLTASVIFGACFVSAKSSEERKKWSHGNCDYRKLSR